MKKALLVIDVQKYYLKQAPEDLPKKIANYISSSQYDLIIFTIFRNFPESNWGKSFGWKDSKTDKDVILPIEFNSLASPDNTYEKHTYSALKVLKLAQKLKSNKIAQVDLCGIDLDACVLATAYDAFDLGYKINVLFDLSCSRYLDNISKPIILRYLQVNPLLLAKDEHPLDEAKLYTDGGSRGNPGPSAAAFIICKTDGSVVKKFGIYLGTSTNNQAEYRGLEAGLKKSAELGIKKLLIYMDSELIVRQLNGIYKVKNKDLLPIYQEVKYLAGRFERAEFVHVPRELNKTADAEVNRVLDENSSAK